jgi:hypothetical protein
MRLYIPKVTTDGDFDNHSPPVHVTILPSTPRSVYAGAKVLRGDLRIRCPGRRQRKIALIHQLTRGIVMFMCNSNSSAVEQTVPITFFGVNTKLAVVLKGAVLDQAKTGSID